MVLYQNRTELEYLAKNCHQELAGYKVTLSST